MKRKKAMLGMWRNGFLTLYSIDFFSVWKELKPIFVRIHINSNCLICNFLEVNYSYSLFRLLYHVCVKYVSSKMNLWNPIHQMSTLGRLYRMRAALPFTIIYNQRHTCTQHRGQLSNIDFLFLLELLCWNPWVNCHRNTVETIH